MNGSGAVKMAASPLHAKAPIFAYPVKPEKLEDRVKAHEVMKEAGFLNSYEIQGDNIKAEINHSPSQNRAILKQTAKPETKNKRRRQMTPLADLLPPKAK